MTGTNSTLQLVALLLVVGVARGVLAAPAPFVHGPLELADPMYGQLPAYVDYPDGLFAGGRYFLTWADGRPGNATQSLVGVRVGLDGALPDAPEGFPALRTLNTMGVGEGALGPYDLASDGASVLLLAVSTVYPSELLVQPVALDGTWLLDAPVALALEVRAGPVPRLAALPGGPYLLVWKHPDDEVRFARVTADAAVRTPGDSRRPRRSEPMDSTSPRTEWGSWSSVSTGGHPAWRPWLCGSARMGACSTPSPSS